MLLLNLLLLIQEPVPASAQPVPAKNPAVQTVQAACAKLAEAKSYTVQQTTKEEGAATTLPTDQPSTGETKPADNKVTVVFTAHVQKGKPTHFVQDKMEAWRDGDVLFHRTSDGKWERIGEAGDHGQDGKDPKADNDAARNMRNRMMLAQAQVAHEMLAGFGDKVATASTSKDGAKTVVTGTFTPEGAAILGQRFTRGGQPGRTGQGGEEGAKSVETSGTYRCVISADGNLESLDFDVAAKGTAKDAAVDRKRHVEIRVTEIGSTNMEVPAEINGKATTKPVKPVEPAKGL